MLYSLLQPFARDVSVLNLLNYITFRAAAAFVSALLVCFMFGPAIIRRLQAMAVHQVVRAGTPDSHAGKGTTPTMGGLIILVATFLPVLLWSRLDNRYVLLAVFVTAWMGAIGFLDDYLKLKQKREGRDEYIEGQGERIEHDARTEITAFFVRAWVRSGLDEVKGNYISYDGVNERYQVTSGVTADGKGPARIEGGRVRAIIQPKGKNSGDAGKGEPLTLKPSDTVHSKE